MKPVTIVILTVLVLAAAVWLGRMTVPDRSAEVLAWRDSATAQLKRSEAADSSRLAASARYAAELLRADSAEVELRTIRARSATMASRIVTGNAVRDSLQQELEQSKTVRDTVKAQAVIIATEQSLSAVKDTLIRSLTDGMEQAQASVVRLRSSLNEILSERTADQLEIGRLRETIAAGLAATKLSRGRSISWLDCTVGVGASSSGLDYRSATCGVSLRSLIGG